MATERMDVPAYSVRSCIIVIIAAFARGAVKQKSLITFLLWSGFEPRNTRSAVLQASKT